MVIRLAHRVLHHRPRTITTNLGPPVTERHFWAPACIVRERAMPRPHQPSSALPSGYITPIACKYCSSEAHLIQLSLHPELNAELRTFECEECGKQTELLVLRQSV